jgi:putative SOS response-associated peptidase YedK
MKDGRPFTFAGLWEGWKDPESTEWLRTCTISQAGLMSSPAQIHPRMPAILPPATSRRWLGDGNFKKVTGPRLPTKVQMWEISPRLNSAEE